MPEIIRKKPSNIQWFLVIVDFSHLNAFTGTRLDCRQRLGRHLADVFRPGQINVQIAQQTVFQPIHTAMNRKRLPARPGVPHDSRTGNVDHLLRYMQLAQLPQFAVAIGQRIDTRSVPLKGVAHMLQPVVRYAQPFAVKRRCDAAAAVVPD